MDTIQTDLAKAQVKIESYDDDNFIDFSIRVKSEGNEILKTASRVKNYQLVIDNSGSMSGQNIELTKQLCTELTKYVVDNQPNSKVSLMTFNTSINYQENIHKQNFETIKKTISQIQAEGGTIFHITFDKLREIAQSFTSQNEELVIIYLTDGQVQSGADQTSLKTSFEFLQQVLRKFVNVVEIHALGMGTSHDPVILDKIISLQTAQSTYQFIKESSEIEQAFKNIVDIIGESFLEVSLNRKDGNLSRIPLFKGAFNMSEKQKNCVLLDMNYLKKHGVTNENMIENFKNNYELLMTINHTFQTKIQLNIKDKRVSKQSTSANEMFEQINQMYNYLDTKLKNIILEFKDYINAKRSQVDKETIKSFSKQIEEISTKYSSSVSKLFKLSSLQRQKLNDNNPSLSTRLKEAQEITEKFTNNQITTVEIAILNQLAYPTITNRLFAKRMQKRKGASIQQFNDYEVLKDKLEKEFQSNEEQLKKAVEPFNEDIGTCFLSCFDIAEALLNKDCLCVTFSVTRSELAIVRPESLKIKAVQPSVISAKSFIDCVKFSLDVSLDNSGSFNKSEGKIVQGMMREVINASMPLYIHEEHWKMARLWLEPILGWVVTLDPLGYHHAQKRTIPFMLLNHCIKQMIELGISNYGLKQANLIQQTCSQILKEEEFDSAQLEIEKSQALKIKEEITNQFNDFMKDVAFRLQEKVTNIEIFLAKLYLAKTLGWVNIKKENIKQFFRYVIEEQLRRQMTEYYTKFLVINLVDLIEHDKIQFKNMNIDILDNLSKYLGIIHYYRFLFEGNDEAKSVQLSQQLTVNEKEVFTLLLADDIDQVKALFMQNTIQGQDKVRRTSIGLKKYFDPYQSPNEVFEHVKEIRKKELIDKVSYVEQMNVKLSKVHVAGMISFTSPDIPNQVKEYVQQLTKSVDKDESLDLINKISKFKQDKNWFLWALAAGNAENLATKLFMLKEKFGTFKKFKNYHRYVLTKGNYLDDDTMTKLETP